MRFLLGTNNYDFSVTPIRLTNNPAPFTQSGNFQYLNNTNNPGYSLTVDANGNVSPTQQGSLVAVYAGTTVGITNIFTNANATNQALYEVYVSGSTSSSTGTIQVGWPALALTNTLNLSTTIAATNFTGVTLHPTNTVIVWVTGGNLLFYKIALRKITD